MSTIINRFNKNQKGQAALETAIILIAFVVVASVFAFTILSAGTNSTEKGKQAISAGLESVQSSMTLKGTMIANGASNAVTSIVFDVALAGGGAPVDLTSGAGSKVVISYRDATQVINATTWTVAWVGNHANDPLLEQGELAEITVNVASASLGPNTPFTIEVVPPSGAVLTINRTTPAAITTVTELN